MKIVHVRDSRQQYTYRLDEPLGKHFDLEFRPEMTPQQMLELGVFGGHYFENEHDEFPPTWFAHAKISDTHDPQMNYFGIGASQSLAEWQSKGWIYEEIRAAGSSGIVAIIWGAVSLAKTSGKSSGG